MLQISSFLLTFYAIILFYFPPDNPQFYSSFGQLDLILMYQRFTFKFKWVYLSKLLINMSTDVESPQT